MLRDVAARRAGPVTHVGLGTFVDPREKVGRCVNSKLSVPFVLWSAPLQTTRVHAAHSWYSPLVPATVPVLPCPAMQGGKLNSRTQRDIVHVVQLGGRELLWYQVF